MVLLYSFRQQIEDFMTNFLFKPKPNILVLDAPMGSGKTKKIKQIILESTKPVIYITPLLEEASNVVGAIVDDKGRQVKDDLGYYMYDLNNPLSSKSFMLPNTNNSDGSKLEGIKHLINNKHNIASTHKLFSMFDYDVINLLQLNNYQLIIDESLNVWNTLNIYEGFGDNKRTMLEDEKQEKGSGSRTDKEILNLIENGVIEVDPIGLLYWQEDKFVVDDDLFFGRVKKLCDLKQLY